MACSTQPYVAFLDADDEWTPDLLHVMRQAIRQFPDAGLYGTGFVTVSCGRTVGRFGIDGHGARPIDFFAAWRRRHVFCASSIVMPTAVFRDLGGFTPGVAVTEDAELYYKIALAYPVVAVPAACARYDIAVPGQAVDYWRHTGTPDFTIQQHHRFLAQALGAPVARSKSFRRYCRSEFRTALRARLAWGDFEALVAFYRMPNVRPALGALERVCGDAMVSLPADGRLARALRRLQLRRRMLRGCVQDCAGDRPA